MEDCYFFVDESTPMEQRKMSVMCMECHKKWPDKGMFWQGSKNGYGPYEYICDKCKKLIYDGKLDDENEDDEEN